MDTHKKTTAVSDGQKRHQYYGFAAEVTANCRTKTDPAPDSEEEAHGLHCV